MPGTDNRSIDPARASQRATAVPDGQLREQSRLSRWRRRHLNTRSVVALIVLGSFVGPGVLALIEATL